jgi:O-succinylbenzoic acid--CoA ligase
LIALDMPASVAFVARTRAAWDCGDAVAPLDVRLDAANRLRTAIAIGATSIAMADGSETRLPSGRGSEEGDALVIATSGSTGVPKYAVHSHEGLAAAARASNTRLGTGSDDAWLVCIPVCHVGGFSVVVRALAGGSRLLLHERFLPERVEEAARQGATCTSLVSAALQRIDASLFRTILLGGGPAPSDRPSNAVTTYGLTETFGGVVYDGAPLDGTEIDIRNGEIWLRGPSLMRRYVGGADDPRDKGGWFPTGDLGSFVNGRLVVDGRSDDLIKTGGEKVWPSHVEAAITRRSDVADVVVRGVADPEWGQRVVAWVVPAGTPPSLDDLRATVKESLPSHCAPREMKLLDAIPRTALGKPDIPALLGDLSS